jgi:aldose 1-epimerase
MKNIYFLLLFVLTVCLTACEKNSNVSVEDWGKLPNGENVKLYTLRNQTGMTVKISNYGGIITHLTAPDRHGAFADVVLGYDSLSGYLKSSPYFGALVGRYGNRIAKGKFKLDDSTYTLAVNNGVNHLHGGTKGFDKALWKTEIINNSEPAIRLQYTSSDGEEGFPGNLSVSVTYTLTHKNELKIKYEATTDKKTVVNLTNHSYFNLNLVESDILSHVLAINADSLVAVDSTLIPTGIIAVKESPFDFRVLKPIGQDIKDFRNEQIANGGGYDHCWILNKKTTPMILAATATERFSGRRLDVLTTEPGLQLYTGNFLTGDIVGKNGKTYGKNGGFCLETQHYPDSPNQKNFPSVVLKPGETYYSETIFRFSTM